MESTDDARRQGLSTSASARVPRALGQRRWWAAALLCVGCAGQVGDPGASHHEDSGGGAGSQPNSPNPIGEAGQAGVGGGAAGAGGNSGTPAAPATDPGRVTLHRLNRAEYNATVRDLLGTSLRPADEFPIDDRGDGFDNVADVLSLSPLHLSLYRSAATRLVNEALANATQRAKVVACDLVTGAAACARTTLEAFTRRAWRRPTTTAEVDRLMTLVTLATGKGDAAEEGLKLGLQAVLLSPNFNFRVELDPDPRSLIAHPVGAYELASRLSYFLWSSMPDDELTAAAASGELQNPSTLTAQVTRMLTSPKAQAFVDNFAGQWLETRVVDEIQPDPTVFPKFDTSLRSAMASETAMFFKDLMTDKLSGADVLSADYTYVNDRLASHYGLAAVGSTTLTRVGLAGNQQRGGLLGQASFLSVTSHPTRTSPVVRGKWVLNQLLCTAIPPPPPNVDTAAVDAPAAGATLRERLVAHRANAVCASCHSLMDPIGFGLENYDSVGAFRTKDGTANIDASGTMPDGTMFSGMRELAQLIAADPRYPACVVSKLYTYALGRSPESSDGHMDVPVLENLTRDYVKSGMHFQKLVKDLVTSKTFLNRRGEPEMP